MPKIKAVLILAIIFSLLTACSANKETKRDFEKSLNTVEVSVLNDNWKKAEEEAKKIKKHYQDALWKIHLLSDETIYDALDLSIDLLISSVKNKNKPESNLQIATIKSYLSSIF